MSELRIDHHRAIGSCMVGDGSPLWGQLTLFVHMAQEEGAVPAGEPHVGQNEAVVWAEQDKRCVGLICWYEPEKGLAWVHFVYVVKSKRRQGVLREMWPVLLEQMKARRIKRWQLGTVVSNDAMQSAAQQFNGERVSLTYEGRT